MWLVGAWLHTKRPEAELLLTCFTAQRRKTGCTLRSAIQPASEESPNEQRKGAQDNKKVQQTIEHAALRQPSKPAADANTANRQEPANTSYITASRNSTSPWKFQRHPTSSRICPTLFQT